MVDFLALPAVPHLVGGDTHVLFRATAPPPPPDAPARGLDFLVALDKSESMDSPLRPFAFDASGESRALLAQRVVRALVEMLRPGDRLGVVTFGSGAATFLPLRAVGADLPGERRWFDEKLAALEFQSAAHETNLSAGLDAAFAAMAAATGDENTRVILLLTDGDANDGITEPETLSEHARAHCPDGVALVTVGIGRDHNAALLDALARECHGQYAFVDDGASMVLAFANVVGAARSTVARALDLELTAASARVALAAVDCAYPVEWAAAGRQCRVLLAGLSADEQRDVLLSVRVAPVPATDPAPVVEDLVQAVWIVDGVRRAPVLVALPVAPPGAAAPEPDARVAAHVERARLLADLQALLRDAALSGDAAVARSRALLDAGSAAVADVRAALSASLGGAGGGPDSRQRLQSVVANLSQQRVVGQQVGTPAQSRCVEELSQHVSQLAEAVAAERPAKRARTSPPQSQLSQVADAGDSQ